MFPNKPNNSIFSPLFCRLLTKNGCFSFQLTLELCSTWSRGGFTSLAEASVPFVTSQSTCFLLHTNFVEPLKAGGRDSHFWKSTDWRDAGRCNKSLVDKCANYGAFKVCFAVFFITGRFKVFFKKHRTIKI